jgi:hypothetical protein
LKDTKKEEAKEIDEKYVLVGCWPLWIWGDDHGHEFAFNRITNVDSHQAKV